MIVVLAHPADRAAVELVRRWAPHEAGLLTSGDLSRSGWRVASGDPASSSVVIAGEPVRADRIAGVLVRTPAIDAAELAAVVAADREYCAAEMTAFLTWWLSGLPVPVINRPTATALAGPGWSPIRWHVAAQRLGLRSAVSRWRAGGADAETDSAAGQSSQLDVITVVGGRPVGAGDPDRGRAAVALARAARAGALVVTFDLRFDPPRLRTASPWVDVTDPAVADALLAALVGADAA